MDSEIIRRNSTLLPSVQTNGSSHDVINNGEVDVVYGGGDDTVIPNVATSPANLHPTSTNHVTNGAALATIKDGNSPHNNEDDTLSANSSTQSSTDVATPPDGGWGWFVVFGSFMIHIVADGITYSFGLFVVELMRVFDSGRGSVSFIPSILVGVTLGCGPIASSLTNRYGCRAATIVGAIVAAIGMAVSAAAPNIVMLYVTIGLCTGLGFGLIYLPAIVSVSMYFEKRRAFATGIAVCGSGIGTFIMAPVTEGLIKRLGWQGAFLVLSTIVLTNIFFGALFRPLPTSGSATGGSSCGTTTTNSNHGGSGDANNMIDTDPENASLKKPPPPNDIICNTFSNNGSFASGDHSLTSVPPEIKINGETFRPIAKQVPAGAVPIGGVPAVSNGSAAGGDGKYSEIARMALSHPVLPSQPQTSKPSLQYGSHSRIYEKQRAAAAAKHNGHHGHRAVNPNAGVMFRKDILYAASLYNIPEYKSNPRRYSRHAIALQDDQRRSLTKAASEARGIGETDGAGLNGEAGNSCESGSGKDKICGCIKGSNEATKAFQEMMDLSLLKDWIFIMFAVSNFLTSIGFNAPYVYTVDRAKLLQIETDDASFLLSVIGIANTMGRIVLGYISDRSWIDRLYLYNACLAVCGISLGMSNFCTDYTSQAVFCAVFGVTSGAYVGLTSVVLVDLLGLDKLTNAFGLLLLFQGIASVIGPPIIGWFYDAIGSYDVGFYFAGSVVFVSGIMLFAIPMVRRWSEAKLDAAKNQEDAEEPFNNKISEEEENNEEGWDDAPPMTMNVPAAANDAIKA